MKKIIAVLIAFICLQQMHAIAEQDSTSQTTTTSTQEEYFNENPHKKSVKCNCPQCQQAQNKKEEERQIQQMAIATLANMAQGLINIGYDPHNPVNIANNVTAIVGTFANFVAHAMSKCKQDTIKELLEDEDFLEELAPLIAQQADPLKNKKLDH